MTATIVPFSKKSPAKIKKTLGAEDGVELDPPTPDDLKGFINTLTFLALQSNSQSVTIDVLGDELNVKIQHHDYDDFIEDKGVVSATMFEIMAGIDFNPGNVKKMSEDLLVAFERLKFENYEEEVVMVVVDSIEDDNETDGNPIP
jgi:hypothetical protein